MLGVSQTPSFQDSPQSGWTRTRYGDTGTMAPVEGITLQGVGHASRRCNRVTCLPRRQRSHA